MWGARGLMEPGNVEEVVGVHSPEGFRIYFVKAVYKSEHKPTERSALDGSGLRETPNLDRARTFSALDTCLR
jgi:hypothetical protein